MTGSAKEIGKLVYLTHHVDVWLKQLNSNFNIPMANRIAKIVKVFDWSTDEGKILLDLRKKTGKWDNMNPKDFKYVLKIYCPDLILKEKRGVTTEEVLPKKYPGTDLNMFDDVPGWMLENINKDESKEAFKIELKDSKTKKTSVKKKSESSNKAAATKRPVKTLNTKKTK